MVITISPEAPLVAPSSFAININSDSDSCGASGLGTCATSGFADDIFSVAEIYQKKMSKRSLKID